MRSLVRALDSNQQTSFSTMDGPAIPSSNFSGVQQDTLRQSAGLSDLHSAYCIVVYSHRKINIKINQIVLMKYDIVRVAY